MKVSQADQVGWAGLVLVGVVLAGGGQAARAAPGPVPKDAAPALRLSAPPCAGADMASALRLGQRLYGKYQKKQWDAGLHTIQRLDFDGDGRCDLIFSYDNGRRAGPDLEGHYPDLVDFYRQTPTGFQRVASDLRYDILAYLNNRSWPLTFMNLDFPQWRYRRDFVNLYVDKPIGPGAIQPDHGGGGDMIVMPVYGAAGAPYLVGGDDTSGGVHAYRWNGRGVMRLPDPAPGARAALRFLSEWMLVRGRKYLDAQDYPGASLTLRQAIHVDPSNPYTYYFLGLTQYLAGQFQTTSADTGAYRYFEQALAHGLPEQAQGYYNLGLAYEALLDAPQAAAAFRRALQLAPHGPRALEVRQHLANLAQRIFIKPQVSEKMFKRNAAENALTGAISSALRQADGGGAPRAPSVAPNASPAARPAREISVADLAALDRQLVALARQHGQVLPEAERNWMIAYKAAFPRTPLADLLARPAYYKALPWVQQWLQAYHSLPAAPPPAPVLREPGRLTPYRP